MHGDLKQILWHAIHTGREINHPLVVRIRLPFHHNRSLHSEPPHCVQTRCLSLPTHFIECTPPSGEVWPLYIYIGHTVGRNSRPRSHSLWNYMVLQIMVNCGSPKYRCWPCFLVSYREDLDPSACDIQDWACGSLVTCMQEKGLLVPKTCPL